MCWATSGRQDARGLSKRERLWLNLTTDRPSQGIYGRSFSPQSLPRAIKPLIGAESLPSVQFSPVFLFNLIIGGA